MIILYNKSTRRQAFKTVFLSFNSYIDPFIFLQRIGDYLSFVYFEKV